MSGPTVIEKNTVLILGAGASVDYGFPTGRRLLFEICSDLSDDANLFNFLSRSMGFPPEDIRRFRSALLSSQAPSVDLFLENRRDFERLGKNVIAAALLPHESLETFARPNNDTGWYEVLFGRMIQGGKFEDNKLSVITFNYDRSLEAFLWFALRHLRGFQPEDALATVQRIRVVHAYGDLSECVWKPQVIPGYSYGLAAERGSLAPEWVEEAAARIRIMHENEDLDKIGQAVDMLTGAEEVIFLGFGFHEENIKRLWFDKVLERKQHTKVKPFRCFASRHGMGEGDVVRAGDLFPMDMKPHTHLGEPQGMHAVEFGTDPNATITEFLKATPCLRHY